MKLLYIVPTINNEGGVARVLSVKANYLIEKLGYDVAILTQNKGNFPLFYSYNEKITFHDMILKGAFFQFFNEYRKSLKNQIAIIKPDIIIVCDNGLKAYTLPFILDGKIPVIFECHGSKYIEEQESKNTFFSKLILELKYKFKNFGANRYDKFVALSSDSLGEWKVNNAIVIPNPLWFSTDKSSDLKNKKAICVARHTHEKGVDRLLDIWQKVIKTHPDWKLDVYGKSAKNQALEKRIEKLNANDNITFYEPVKNINEKYLESSLYLMTSRFEGFPMVLIEAMASGLPCIAYDCPCGPRAIITDKNGYLIKNGNENDFVKAIENLIEDENQRFEMGKKAKLSSEKYNIDAIMKTWDELFIEIKKKKSHVI
jgi:glycosyltransferase involved in cell wall biosynthesis